MLNTICGLSALLPREFEAGKNEIDIVGWHMEQDRGVRKYVLLLEDGRECKQMHANSLLQAIAEFEQANPSILFKNADGSFKYTQPVHIIFNFTPKSGRSSSFVSNYQGIKVSLKGKV